MKINVLFTAFMLLATSLFGQTATYNSMTELLDYNADEIDTIVSTKFYRLYLDDNDYALEVHHCVTFSFNHKHDTHDSTFLTFGKYYLKGEEMLMCDSMNGFSLVAFFEDAQKLCFNKGFRHIIGKEFFLENRLNKKVFGIIIPIVFENQLDTVSYQNDEVQRKLRFGYYQSSFKKMNLTADGSYVILHLFPKDTISRGSWQREGNLISFQDDHLNRPFYAALEGSSWWNEIKAPAMPGVLFDNQTVDDQFIYTGFDESGPSYKETDMHMMGEYFMNALFKCHLKDSQYAYIEFYDSIFSIEVWYFIDDIFLHKTLAYGIFKKDKDIIQTTDINGFVMEFEITADSILTMNRGFCPWNDKTFELVDKTWHYPEYTYFGDAEEIEYPFEFFRTQEPIGVELMGNYHFKVEPNCHIDICLTKHDCFTLSIWGLPYMSGTWLREGNLLIFHDDCIEQPIFALIDKDGIVPFFPGLFGKEKCKFPNEKQH